MGNLLAICGAATLVAWATTRREEVKALDMFQIDLGWMWKVRNLKKEEDSDGAMMLPGGGCVSCRTWRFCETFWILQPTTKAREHETKMVLELMMNMSIASDKAKKSLKRW